MTSSAATVPVANEKDLFNAALKNAHDLLAETEKEPKDAKATELTRALAVEIGRAGATPDRYVRALRQLEDVLQQQETRIRALKEFNRRFKNLVSLADEEESDKMKPEPAGETAKPADQPDETGATKAKATRKKRPRRS